MTGGDEQRRRAAERIARGIELYAAGDLSSSATELEAALALCPDHVGARACLAFIRSRTVGGTAAGPADSLTAVSDAILNGGAPPPLAARESPWDPVPLTPTGPDSARPPSAPAAAASGPAQASPPAAAPRRAGSTSSVLRMPPLAERLLTPNDGHMEIAEPVTREWLGAAAPTGIDEPALRTSADPDPAKPPPLETIAEMGAADHSLFEFEAEPTPLPEPRSSARRRPDDTSPVGPALAEDPPFDPLSLSPHVDDGDLTPPPDLSPLAPLEAARDSGEEGEEGTAPTNPFIKGPRLAEYATFGHGAQVGDLPPVPPTPSEASKKVARSGTLSSAVQAMERGDLKGAIEACERAVTELGGLDTEACRPLHPLLEQTYQALLGSFDRYPVALSTGAKGLDPRSAFLLSRLDGTLTIDDVFDVSGMARLEAMRLLALLVHGGAVTLK